MMMKSLASLLLVAATAAACGGGSSKPPATPPPADPVPMKEPVAAEASMPDPGPAEPAPPEEPPAPDPAQIKADLLAAETTAFEKAKPVFEKWCAKCHTKGAKQANAKKLREFDMTAYPFGGEHAMDIGAEIRKTLGIGGGKVTMPADKKGAVKGDELALIAAWADAFDASHKGGAHEGHGHKH